MADVRVDPAELTREAEKIGASVAHWAEVRAQPWPSAGECGSGVVSAAVDGLSSWYRAHWARTGDTVSQLESLLGQAAAAYQGADQQVSSAASVGVS